MDFYNNLSAICKSKGITISALLQKCGYDKSYGTRWKNGTTPNSKVVAVLADYLHIPVNVLFDRKTQTPTLETLETVPNNNVYMIPVFENVSAGFGAYACSDIMDYNPVMITNPADVDDTICIKVIGDSMYPKIEEGDIIVVHKQPIVESGQFAVIMIDKEEGVVKKIIYGNNWIELISINPMYPPRRFDGSEVLRLSVVGLVKQIIKNV